MFNLAKKKRMKFSVIIFALATFFCINSNAQNKKAKIQCIAFYNIENLFDTINDPNFNDDDFTPEGSYRWTGERYWAKIKNMSEVISQIGDEYVKGGPAIIGIAEIENRSVLYDLTQSAALKQSDYDIVHYDCEYSRGVDVGFLYRKQHFTPTRSISYKLQLPDNYKTRDVLMVAGELDGETIHILVNHWPSRRGGEKRSEPGRMAAAQLCRSISDSIFRTSSDAKIFIMGDFNDDPSDKSILEGLQAKTTKDNLQVNELFNPYFALYKKGIGSLAYQDAWNLFDQIIVSEPLVRENINGYKLVAAKVFNRKFLTQKEGQYAGYPFRTYVGETWQGGYADHFPSYVFIAKPKQKK
jgi:hypothetical protein